MNLKRRQKFGFALMTAAICFLSACAKESCSCLMPLYPVAGAPVAAELEKAGELPATWEWIGRIDKLRRELE